MLSEAQVATFLTKPQQGPAAAGWVEDHFAALLDAAYQQLGAPILLVWDGLLDPGFLTSTGLNPP